jgi:hypothetical protein
MRKHIKPWSALQYGVAEAVKSAGGMAVAVVDAVADVLGAAMKDSGVLGASLVKSVSQIAEQTVRGAGKVGGEMSYVAQGFLKGLLRATEETGEEALLTIGYAAACFVKQAGALGLDCVAATKGLIEGAIGLAKELGLDTTQAASVAAQGALDAAYEVGSAAGEKVRDALQGAIAGVKVVIREPFRTKTR